MTTQSATDPVEQVLLPAVRDLGDFEVRRALPSAQRRMVGPFIFLDSFGPAVFRAGEGADSRPHPHIGLATLTYLIDGEMDHRDSEGFSQTIRPGEVNLMTAGRGIIHSERSGTDLRTRDHQLFGFQTWLALPLDLEETDPGFQHVAASELPLITDGGAVVRLLAGTFGGLRSPTRIFSDTLYADVALAPGTHFRIDAEHVERAVYVVEGRIEVVGQTGRFGKDQLVVLRPDTEIVIVAQGPARLMMLGGEPLPGKRYIFWNFVSSRRERIDQAAEEWRSGRFRGMAGDEEFIPLPEMPRWRVS